MVLAGCQTAENMTNGLASMKGKPYHVAFEKLGIPDQERMIDGKRVFTWATQNSGSYTVSSPTSGTAYVGGTAVPFQVQSTSTEAYNYYCRVDIMVGATGIIEHTKYSGNIGGCMDWSRRLAPKA